MEFGGNVPKSLVQKSSIDRQAVVLTKLKTYLKKNFPE
jgi:hypothetical protein